MDINYINYNYCSFALYFLCLKNIIFNNGKHIIENIYHHPNFPGSQLDSNYATLSVNLNWMHFPSNYLQTTLGKQIDLIFSKLHQPHSIHPLPPECRLTYVSISPWAKSKCYMRTSLLYLSSHPSISISNATKHSTWCLFSPFTTPPHNIHRELCPWL